MRLNDTSAYQEMMINSKMLEVPRGTYQRELNIHRVRKIAAAFDIRRLNPPKVSYRNGRYYVFDGQHTIAALKLLNGGQDLMIRCHVYRGLSENEEALLFAQQTGVSAKLTPGAWMRALIYGGDLEAMAFLKATESVGLRLDYGQRRGKYRIACIGTAFEEFKRVGPDRYKEALSIIVDAWHGDPESLRSETVQGVVRFVELYHGEYDPRRLVSRLHRADPLTIYREGRAMGVNLAGYKKYLYQVYALYNGGGKKCVLPHEILNNEVSRIMLFSGRDRMTKHCTTFMVDGYEVRATFAESRNAAVTGHLKQILLASFAGNTPAGSGILAAAPGGWYPKDGRR